MRTIKVDVGMPAHGRPVFTSQAVESVLSQTFGEFKLLVLDDSQGDEILHALEPYLGDERVEHRAVAPMTAMAAMTALMQDGSAEYFAFLHDDDRWGPEFLQRRLEFLEANPGCAFVFSGHVDIDAQGQVTASYPGRLSPGTVDRSQMFPRFCLENVVDTMHSVLARRTALEAAGARLDPDVPRLFDWDLWLRLALTGGAGFVAGEKDVHYRVHGEQMSGSAGMASDTLAMFERADALVSERLPEHALSQAARRRRRADLLAAVALDRLADDDLAGARAALRGALRCSPRVALSRRAAAAGAGVLLGRRSRDAIARLRSRRYRRASRAGQGPAG